MERMGKEVFVCEPVVAPDAVDPGRLALVSATFAETRSHFGEARYEFHVGARLLPEMTSRGMLITGDPDSVEEEWLRRTGRPLAWPEDTDISGGS